MTKKEKVTERPKINPKRETPATPPKLIDYLRSSGLDVSGLRLEQDVDGELPDGTLTACRLYAQVDGAITVEIEQSASDYESEFDVEITLIEYEDAE